MFHFPELMFPNALKKSYDVDKEEFNAAAPLICTIIAKDLLKMPSQLDKIL